MKHDMMSDPDGVADPVEGAAPVETIEEPTPEVLLDPEKHFFVDGETAPREYPAGEVRSRRLWVEERNVEHVHDHESGCWVYRHM